MSRRHASSVTLVVAAALGVFISTQVSSGQRAQTHRLPSAPSGVFLPRVAPVSLRVPRLLGSPRVGETITATTGVWKHHPSLLEYQWVRCDSRGANCARIPHATSNTIRISPGLVGRTLRVRLTAAN